MYTRVALNVPLSKFITFYILLNLYVYFSSTHKTTGDDNVDISTHNEENQEHLHKNTVDDVKEEQMSADEDASAVEVEMDDLTSLRRESDLFLKRQSLNEVEDELLSRMEAMALRREAVEKFEKEVTMLGTFENILKAMTKQTFIFCAVDRRRSENRATSEHFDAKTATNLPNKRGQIIFHRVCTNLYGREF